MTSNDIAVLSDLDEFLIFQAMQADVFIVNSLEEARLKMLEIETKYKIVYMNVELAKKMSEDLEKYSEKPYPIVTVLPSSKSGAKVGMENIMKIAKETLGIDVFKE